jgi:beta-galactosidase/beta-glucuronidase
MSKRKRESAPMHDYPRPQLQREHWTSLNGKWDFAIDADGSITSPDDVNWKRPITVPFAPETPMSGIEDTSLFRACWYRRTVDTPPLNDGERLLLHFGAVDYLATVWVNGHVAARHEGGYTPFTADITEMLAPGKTQMIIVRAEDDPLDLAKPRGKQDWKLDPHSIWYPRTSGIWQTVWLERVPATYIRRLRWTPNVARWEVTLATLIGGERREDLRLRVRLRVADRMLAEDTYAVNDGELHRVIRLPDPGIDDARNDLFWWPWSPTLIDADIDLLDANDEPIDSVQSYTAMRSVSIQGDRLVMNGRPMYLRMVLDQGYWRESGMTAPSDAALRRDVELAKEMGFNGVRKHQKIEDPRYLYWADRLGLMVWEEMPSAYRFDASTVRRVTREWTEAIERDISHPCIICWVPLNESWGVPDLPDRSDQRDFVRALRRKRRLGEHRQRHHHDP